MIYEYPHEYTLLWEQHGNPFVIADNPFFNEKTSLFFVVTLFLSLDFILSI